MVYQASGPVLSYPKPEKRLNLRSIQPRPLEPLNSRPSPNTEVISEAWIRDHPPVKFLSKWTRSTHIVPAAAPRTFTRGIKEAFEAGELKEQRKAKVARIADALIKKKVEHELGQPLEGVVPPSEQPQLINVLDRYSVDSEESGDGITLFVAHANGFPRRIWEPVLKAIFELQEEEICAGPTIREVWSFEAVNHGDSAMLNEPHLGDVFDWLDNSRDMLNFILNYLPPTPSGTLPCLLPRVSAQEADERLRSGFSGRKLVGMGHSIGGCTLTRAALDSEAVWSALILVDPIFLPPLQNDPSGGIAKLLAGAVSRRMRWATKEEALQSFKQTPFFQAWAPDALDAYIQYGICDDPQYGGVRLKQSGFQEACSFAERRATYETWQLLENLDPKIRLFWVMSGRRPVVTGAEDVTQQTVWRRPENSSNIRVPGAGHLVVHEAPTALAKAVIDFFSDQAPTSKL